MEEFKKLGLSDRTIKALEKKGYTKPTTIQAKAIPLLMEGKKDVIGQSQTGTGKTASFALPILEKIKENSKHVQAIILTPTRELAIQISKEFDLLKGDRDIDVLAVYGGSSIDAQRQSLRSGIDIVVGTPGRVMDLQRRNSLKLDYIKYAVLDEADEMLNMGFVEDIESILQHTPPDKNMLLFSATMPGPIKKIAKKYMRDYELIEIEKTQPITDTVEQIYYEINPKDRVEGLRRIFDYHMDFYGIIFCNTKATVDNITNKLIKMNYNVASIHGDITQSQREKILQQFRDKHITILIATDVAARGIDVQDLTHVINFSLPQSPESYVHRIGRTGRAGKKGISITLVIPSERGKLKFVEKLNNCKIEKQKLPTAAKIIENKELQIKEIIENIINANKGKPSKYKYMADELLKDHSPDEVVSAILKYSFKNELDKTNYTELSEARSGGSGGSDYSGSRGGSGRRSGSRFGRGRSKGRSGDRRSKGRFSSRGSRSKESDNKRSDSQNPDKKRFGKSSDKKKKSFGRSGSKFKIRNRD